MVRLGVGLPLVPDAAIRIVMPEAEEAEPQVITEVPPHEPDHPGRSPLPDVDQLVGDQLGVLPGDDCIEQVGTHEHERSEGHGRRS